MKLTEARIKEIIKEEIDKMNEQEMSAKTLEPEVVDILKKLSVEEQAVINQYIATIKAGNL